MKKKCKKFSYINVFKRCEKFCGKPSGSLQFSTYAQAWFKNANNWGRPWLSQVFVVVIFNSHSMQFSTNPSRYSLGVPIIG